MQTGAGPGAVCAVLHVFGALLMVLCGFCAGDVCCRRAIARRRALEQTLALLGRLRQEIEYRRADLPQLYERLAEQSPPPLAGFAAAGSFQALSPPPSLTGEEKNSFAECFSGMGHAAGAQECGRLAYYTARFSDFLDAARRAETAACRIDRKLGLAVGAMAALALL